MLTNKVEVHASLWKNLRNNSEGRKYVIHIKFKHVQNNIMYFYRYILICKSLTICTGMIKYRIVVSAAEREGNGTPGTSFVFVNF